MKKKQRYVKLKGNSCPMGRKRSGWKMELHIVSIPGDGIGPEIVAEAKKVLNKVAEKYGHTIEWKDILMGGASIDVHGVPLTQEAVCCRYESR